MGTGRVFALRGRSSDHFCSAGGGFSSSRMICSLFDWQIKDTWGPRRDPPVRHGTKRGLAGEGLQPLGFQFQGKSSPMRLIG